MSFSIGLCISPTSDNQVRMIRGALGYINEHPDLRVYKEGAMPYLPWERARNWKGDGIIATTEDKSRQEQLIRLKQPAVSVTGHLDPHDDLPTVLSDNHAIGKLAAEHLVEQGLHQFAYVGHEDWYTDRVRMEGFKETIERAGYTCQLIDVRLKRKHGRHASDVFEVNLSPLSKEIRRLETPVGVGVAHDEFAHDVIATCKALNKHVPYDISVVGVNNHRLICETTDPPISSIRQRAERIGYEAAALMHRLLKGDSPPTKPILLPPGNLVLRRSSDYLAIDDRMIRQAIQEIRRYCGSPITAEDIADKLLVSRRTLDKRFVAAVGHPSAEEIRLSRIRLAKQLLSDTELQIVAIGFRCGYESTSGFIRAFREATEQTPRSFRLQASG